MAILFTIAGLDHLEPQPVTLSSAFTISCWVKNTSATVGATDQNIAGATPLSSFTHVNYRIFRSGTANRWNFFVREGSSTDTLADSGTNSANNTDWTQLVARRDGNQLTLFVGGVKQTEPSAASFTGVTEPDNSFIGASPNLSGTGITFYDGNIAEFAIYNVALTDGECIALGERAPVQLIRPQNISYYAPLYDAVPTTIPDYSGNQNNATKINTPADADIHPPVARFTRKATPYSSGVRPAPTIFLQVSELGNKYIVNKATLSQSELLSQYEVFRATLVQGELSNKYAVNIFKLGQSELSNRYEVFKSTLAQGELSNKYKVNPVSLSTGEMSSLYAIEVFKLQQGELGNKYNVIPALLKLGELGQKFAIAAFKLKQSELSNLYEVQDQKVEKQLEAIYGLRFVQTVEGIYGETIARQLLASAFYTVSAQLDFPYVMNEPVVKQIDNLYDILAVDKVEKQIDGLYSMATTKAQVDSPYTLVQKLAAQVSNPYALATNIKKQQDFLFDIKVTDPVTKQFKGVYPILSTQLINITGVPTITVGGQTLDVSDVDISIDEFSFIWRANIKILNIEDYVLFQINDDVILNLYGEIFNLVVESKSLTRGSPPDLDMAITAVSPAIKFAFPRASALDLTFTSDVGAEAAAEQAVGVLIDWQMIDWVIPANRLAIKDGSPIELVQRIVRAGGGVLESKPNGDLLARPQFPISLNKFDTGSVDQVYLDTQDNLSVSERFSPTKLLNKFRISDVRGGDRDIMDFVFNDIVVNGNDTKSTTEGRLRIFPSPFRTNVVVESSQGATIGYQLVGIATELLTEDVEFKEGIASVSKPVDSISSVTWKAIDLGGVSFVSGESGLLSASTVNLYSLATISYFTRFIEYSVTGVPDIDVQFRLEKA